MKRIRTKSKFILKVTVANPVIFQELRVLHKVVRPDFVEETYVPETGATVSLAYMPPSVIPEEGTKEWMIYQQYIQWKSDYEYDLSQYSIARNKLLLATCVKIVKAKRDWRKDMMEGEWIQDLEVAGIEVTAVNRKILYLKAVVLSYETDYLKVLAAATPEEVTMADVFNAFDYFRSIIQRLSPLQGDPDLAKRRDLVLTELLRDADSLISATELRKSSDNMVSVAENHKGGADSS